MSGTSGPHGTTSSHSADLSKSLVSRLQARTDLDGSILYRLIWKTRDTPLRRSICALRASTASISGKGSISPLKGWPTPTTRDHKDGASEGTAPVNALLGREVWLAGWPTPQARDHFPAHTSEYIAAKKALGHGMSNLNDYATMTGPIRLTASGEVLTGCFAEMESGGQLNPAHSRWLMGFPAAWDSCGVTAMQSTSRQRLRSLKRP